MISEHYDYRDLEELHLDEEVIQAKKQADRDIQNSQELLKELTKLKSTNYDNKTPDLFSCTSLPFMEVVLSYQNTTDYPEEFNPKNQIICLH
jgi:hypothetical protein